MLRKKDRGVYSVADMHVFVIARGNIELTDEILQSSCVHHLCVFVKVNCV